VIVKDFLAWGSKSKRGTRSWPGQHEIDFRYPRPRDRRQLATFRFISGTWRTGTGSRGRSCSRSSDRTSACTTIQSLFRKGANAFHDPRRWLSTGCRTRGMLQHARMASAADKLHSALDRGRP